MNFLRVSRGAGVVIRIFLGHHADDLVGTFLINLFRGAGPSGLWRNARDLSRRVGTDLQIVRPLLGVWREEINRYVGSDG